jgi:hypothetical protein
MALIKKMEKNWVPQLPRAKLPMSMSHTPSLLIRQVIAKPAPLAVRQPCLNLVLLLGNTNTVMIMDILPLLVSSKTTLLPREILNIFRIMMMKKKFQPLGPKSSFYGGKKRIYISRFCGSSHTLFYLHFS